MLLIFLLGISIFHQGEACFRKRETADSNITCQENWTKNEETGFCYFLGTVNGSMTVNQVRTACQNIGGDLASIHSQEENDFVAGLSPEGEPARNIVIGPKRIVLGDRDRNFANFDETKFDYSNFGGAEPNGGECVYMVSDSYYDLRRGHWYDVPCNHRSSFYVCKAEPL